MSGCKGKDRGNRKSQKVGGKALIYVGGSGGNVKRQKQLHVCCVHAVSDIYSVDTNLESLGINLLRECC